MEDWYATHTDKCATLMAEITAHAEQCTKAINATLLKFNCSPNVTCDAHSISGEKFDMRIAIRDDKFNYLLSNSVSGEFIETTITEDALTIFLQKNMGLYNEVCDQMRANGIPRRMV